jgi:hypothetical protein
MINFNKPKNKKLKREQSAMFNNDKIKGEQSATLNNDKKKRFKCHKYK